MKKEDLQLVGATACLIASKVNNDYNNISNNVIFVNALQTIVYSGNF